MNESQRRLRNQMEHAQDHKLSVVELLLIKRYKTSKFCNQFIFNLCKCVIANFDFNSNGMGSEG